MIGSSSRSTTSRSMASLEPVFWGDFEQAYRQAAAGADCRFRRRRHRSNAGRPSSGARGRRPHIVELAADWLRRPGTRSRNLPIDFDSHAESNTNALRGGGECPSSAPLRHASCWTVTRAAADQVIVTALAGCLSGWTRSPDGPHRRPQPRPRCRPRRCQNLSSTVGFTLSYNPLVLSHPTWDAARRERWRQSPPRSRQCRRATPSSCCDSCHPTRGLRERLIGAPSGGPALQLCRGARPTMVACRYRASTVADPAAPSESPRGLRQHPFAVRATLTPNLRLVFVYSTRAAPCRDRRGKGGRGRRDDPRPTRGSPGQDLKRGSDRSSTRPAGAGMAGRNPPHGRRPSCEYGQAASQSPSPFATSVASVPMNPGMSAPASSECRTPSRAARAGPCVRSCPGPCPSQGPSTYSTFRAIFCPIMRTPGRTRSPATAMAPMWAWMPKRSA